jgi:hypothetical protein
METQDQVVVLSMQEDESKTHKQLPKLQFERYQFEMSLEIAISLMGTEYTVSAIIYAMTVGECPQGS